MNKKFKRVLSLLLSVAMTFSCLTAVYTQQAFADDKPTIYLVGDSTGCHYSDSTDNGYYYKRVGFGDKLSEYFDSSKVNFSNLAMSGRSSLSFLSESNYQTLISNIKPNDILLIAFGHNDEKTTEGLYTSPVLDSTDTASFMYNLKTNYIDAAQAKGATPILCSPIVRLPSGEAFLDKDLHKVNGGDYRLCAEKLAEECGIDFIDLTTLTQNQYLKVGLTEAANYHAVTNLLSVDKTHINSYGASMISYLIYSNAPTSLAQYKLDGMTEPVNNLEPDPSYVDPSTAAESTGDITGEALNSALWSTTSPWYGSVFGMIGATPSTKESFTQYYNITENNENNTVNIKAVGGKSKLSATDDGLAFYYQPISALENFQISADVHVNSVDTTNSQVSFGAMMTDKIAVDKRYTSDAKFEMGNYVAAGPYKMASSKSYAGFIKQNSSMDYETVLPKENLPKVGDDIHVSISKAGTYYTVAYGDYVTKFQLNETQMRGVIYAGFFASRNADITISNIVYNNEVVEDIVEPEIPPTLDHENSSSFDYWAEEHLADDGTHVKSGPIGMNGSIIDVTSKALGRLSSGDMTDPAHKAYKIGKYNTDSFGSVKFTPAADGWATLYFYCADDKSYYVSTTAVDKAAAEYTITENPYTIPVEYGKDYYIYTSATSNFALIGITYQKKETAVVSGSINVNSESGYTIADNSKLTFTNTSTGDITSLDITGNTYSVELAKGFDYTCDFSGTDTLIIDPNNASLRVDEAVTFDVSLIDAGSETVTGTVYGPAGETAVITFVGGAGPIEVTIGADGKGTYTTALKPGTYSVEVSDISGYKVSELSKTSLTVKHNGAENYKNVLYTKLNVDGVTAYDVYVDNSGLCYSGKANVFTTLTDAMAAIDASSLKGSSAQRFIVHVAPGTYEEQFFVNKDYVSIIADSNDDGVFNSEVDGNVIITWYYGIDYMYYSIDPKTGFYSKEYAVDKHTKTACVQKWGATMIVEGSNFYTEGITYQNSFNLELSDAELADGVENDMSAGSPANTTYDRTQDGADVRLTTATERAAALVIDGQQAEFYKCTFLGSQDTVYTGNYNHYFNDCIIAGETDYIFGNGGTTIFDDCELRWINYHYPTTSAANKTKPGYIAVPRGSYIFRICRITSDFGKDNQTGATDIITKGYYGRPWGNTASVLFMDCETNGYILDDGWSSMSGVDPVEVDFREYGNKSNGAEFYSTLTSTNPTTLSGLNRILGADEALSLAAKYDWNIFGTWKPINHVGYEGNPNIYKFDFTPGAESVVSPVKDVNGTAELTSTGLAYHGSAYGAKMGSGSAMTVYVGTGGDMSIGVNSSYNGNEGTLELYKNYESVNDVPIDTINFANDVDNEMKTFNVTNVADGDSFTVKYSGDLTFYCGNITVTSTNAVLTTAPVTNDYNFDLAKAAEGHAQGDEITGTIHDDNDVTEITLDGFKYHGTQYGLTSGALATAKFTVATAGKATITINSSYQENNEKVTLIGPDGTTDLGSVPLVGIKSDVIKAQLDPGEYTLKFVIPDGATYTNSEGTTKNVTAFYLSGINISMSEEGTLAAPKEVVPTTVYAYDFKTVTGYNTNDAVTGDIYDTNNAAPITVVANVKYKDTSFGFDNKLDAEIQFTVATAGNTTITIPSDYQDNNAVVNLYDASNNLVATSGQITGKNTTGKIEAELQPGTYTIKYESFGTGINDFYTSGLTIETTGALGVAEEPIPTTKYVYDFTAATDISSGEVYDSNSVAPITLTGVGNLIKFHNADFGFNIGNGAEISFDVTTAGSTTITIPSSYSGNAGKIVLLNGDSVIASTEDLSGVGEGTITTELVVGTYTLRYDVTGSFYTSGLTIETTGALGVAEEPIPTTKYVYDFTAATDISSGEVYDSNSVAPITLTGVGNLIKFHNADFGFNIGNGAEISFDVTTAGSATITIPSSYSGNAGKIVLLNGDSVIASTEDLSGVGEGTITTELVVGTYTLRYDVTGSFYTSGLTIETTGALGVAEEPAPTTVDYQYDFAYAATSITTTDKAAATGNALAKITLDASNGGNFRTQNDEYGYQVSTNSIIGFTLAGDSEANATITLASSYNKAASLIEIYKVGSGTPVAKINVAQGVTGDVSAEFKAVKGDYEIRFTDSSNQYISGLKITVPVAVSIGARPDVRGNVNEDNVVDMRDAIAALNNVALDITTEAILNSDVNLDGVITKADASEILKNVYFA